MPVAAVGDPLACERPRVTGFYVPAEGAVYTTLPAKCIVCGDEFEVFAADPSQFEAFLADIVEASEWMPPWSALSWPDRHPLLAVSCGRLVHDLETVTSALRLHGGEIAFHMYTLSDPPGG